MKTDSFWEILAWIFFIANTLCIVELIDVLLFKKPYITFFLVIFAICFYLNRKIYKAFFMKDFVRPIVRGKIKVVAWRIKS
jgi:hypothetical protein